MFYFAFSHIHTSFPLAHDDCALDTEALQGWKETSPQKVREGEPDSFTPASNENLLTDVHPDDFSLSVKVEDSSIITTF